MQPLRPQLRRSPSELHLNLMPGASCPWDCLRGTAFRRGGPQIVECTKIPRGRGEAILKKYCMCPSILSEGRIGPRSLQFNKRKTVLQGGSEKPSISTRWLEGHQSTREVKCWGKCIRVSMEIRGPWVWNCWALCCWHRNLPSGGLHGTGSSSDCCPRSEGSQTGRSGAARGLFHG